MQLQTDAHGELTMNKLFILICPRQEFRSFEQLGNKFPMKAESFFSVWCWGGVSASLLVLEVLLREKIDDLNCTDVRVRKVQLSYINNNVGFSLSFIICELAECC